MKNIAVICAGLLCAVACFTLIACGQNTRLTLAAAQGIAAAADRSEGIARSFADTLPDHAAGITGNSEQIRALLTVAAGETEAGKLLADLARTREAEIRALEAHWRQDAAQALAQQRQESAAEIERIKQEYAMPWWQKALAFVGGTTGLLAAARGAIAVAGNFIGIPTWLTSIIRVVSGGGGLVAKISALKTLVAGSEHGLAALAELERAVPGLTGPNGLIHKHTGGVYTSLVEIFKDYAKGYAIDTGHADLAKRELTEVRNELPTSGGLPHIDSPVAKAT